MLRKFFRWLRPPAVIAPIPYDRAYFCLRCREYSLGRQPKCAPHPHKVVAVHYLREKQKERVTRLAEQNQTLRGLKRTRPEDATPRPCENALLYLTRIERPLR